MWKLYLRFKILFLKGEIRYTLKGFIYRLTFFYRTRKEDKYLPSYSKGYNNSHLFSNKDRANSLMIACKRLEILELFYQHKYFIRTNSTYNYDVNINLYVTEQLRYLNEKYVINDLENEINTISRLRTSLQTVLYSEKDIKTINDYIVIRYQKYKEILKYCLPVILL